MFQRVEKMDKKEKGPSWLANEIYFSKLICELRGRQVLKGLSLLVYYINFGNVKKSLVYQ